MALSIYAQAFACTWALKKHSTFLLKLVACIWCSMSSIRGRRYFFKQLPPLKTIAIGSPCRVSSLTDLLGDNSFIPHRDLILSSSIYACVSLMYISAQWSPWWNRFHFTFVPYQCFWRFFSVYMLDTTFKQSLSSFSKSSNLSKNWYLVHSSF